jgi:hypothetical protein
MSQLQQGTGMTRISYAKALGLLTGCLLAAACSTPVETRLTSSGTGLSPAARLTVVTAETDGAVLHAETRRLFEQYLTARGSSFSEAGDYLIEFAPGQRAADVILYQDPAKPSASPAKGRSLLSSCNDQLHRVTLVVLKRETGDVAYRGDAEERHCKATLNQTLPFLVETLVADLEKPAGTRVTTRKGQY